MIHVLIADDHKILREGLMVMLSEQDDIEVAGEAENGHGVITILKSIKIDVILMDVNMPGKDGMETTQYVTTNYPGIKVIALTMLEQGSFVQYMLKCGASGYLLKNAGKDQVLHAIRTVHAGNRYLSPGATDLLINTVTQQKQFSKQFIPDLTRREKEVLHHIAKGHSDVEIASKLFVSKTTIESHRKNLRTKLGAKNSAEMVRIAMERGLL